MPLSKTLDPKDYQRFNSIRYVEMMRGVFAGKFQHEHRAWEYGIALKACEDAKEILDIGGGGSIFAPIAAITGKAIHEVDVQDATKEISQQTLKLQEIARVNRRVMPFPISFHLADFMEWEGPMFDAVTCLSVLEHVPNDTLFLQKLTEHVRPGGVLVVTVDYSLDGGKKSGWHLRTYRESSILELAAASGMEWFDGYDYTWHGNNVYNWTFASVVLRKF